MENLRFNSVGDAAAFLAGDEKVKQRVENEISYSKVVNNLLLLRIKKGVSQKELAQSMSCDPSKISRMEAGNDLQLKLGDVTQYASALDVKITMLFEDTSLPAAEQIKRHVFAIHDQLECLVQLAKRVDGDDEIISKIHVFCGEVLFNFLTRFEDSYKNLCLVSEHPKPLLTTSALNTEEMNKVEDKSTEPSCC